VSEFVDTSVLLYAYDPAAGTRHETARELLGRLGRRRDGALSVQVLQEFYVNATRKVAVPMSTADAIARVGVLARWPVHSPVAADVVAAAELAERNQLSFWGAMIVRSASEMGCRTLWSEDLNAGQVIAGVRIANPFVP